MNPTNSMNSIPVVILCGGMGTRLREETEYKPKPMVEIGGKPVLWHIMKLFALFAFRTRTTDTFFRFGLRKLNRET